MKRLLLHSTIAFRIHADTVVRTAGYWVGITRWSLTEIGFLKPIQSASRLLCTVMFIEENCNRYSNRCADTSCVWVVACFPNTAGILHLIRPSVCSLIFTKGGLSVSPTYFCCIQSMQVKFAVKLNCKTIILSGIFYIELHFSFHSFLKNTAVVWLVDLRMSLNVGWSPCPLTMFLHHENGV